MVSDACQVDAHGAAPAGSAARPRDFVPASSSSNGTAGAPSDRTCIIVFGAYESTKVQAAPKPWAWDPVLYYLGDFNGKSLDVSGSHEQCGSPSCV
jgi:hypothetical protein